MEVVPHRQWLRARHDDADSPGPLVLEHHDRAEIGALRDVRKPGAPMGRNDSQAIPQERDEQAQGVRAQIDRGRSLKKSRAVLVTNGVDISGPVVVRTYLKRWQTERGYQDWKRAMGGMAYHTTDLRRIRSYIWIGFLAYALARRAKQLLEAKVKVGLPTLLAVRKRAVRSMIAARKPEGQPPESLIPTRLFEAQRLETMNTRAA